MKRASLWCRDSVCHDQEEVQEDDWDGAVEGEELSCAALRAGVLEKAALGHFKVHFGAQILMYSAVSQARRYCQSHPVIPSVSLPTPTVAKESVVPKAFRQPATRPQAGPATTLEVLKSNSSQRNPPVNHPAFSKRASHAKERTEAQ